MKDYLQKRRTYIIILAVLLLITAFFLGKVYDRYANSLAPSSDNAYELLMSNDILNGNLLLKGWHISQDNFLLNEVPFYVIGIKLVGATPKLLHTVPVLLYLIILASSAFLAVKQLSKKRKLASLLVLSTLIVVGAPALYQALLVSSLHSGTIILSLLSVISIYYYLQTEKTKPWLIIFFILTFLNFFSDFLSFFIATGPIILYALYHYTEKHELRKYGYIVLSALFACFVSGLFLMGLNHRTFTLVPTSTDFVSLTAFSNNVYLSIYSILQLFGANFFGLKVVHFLTIVSFLRFLVLASVFYSLCKISRNWQHRIYNMDPITEILSLGAIINLLAFIFSNQPVDLSSVRYLTPFLIFTSIVLARKLANSKRVMEISLVVLLIFFVSGIEFAKNIHHAVYTNYFQVNLTQLLQKDNLTYGYGTYWNANIVTAESNQSVKIRDVQIVDNQVAPYYWLTKDTWYKPNQNPPAHFFIYNTDDPTIDYYSAAVNSFGNPDSVLKVDGYTVLVWNYDISTKIQTQF